MIRYRSFMSASFSQTEAQNPRKKHEQSFLISTCLLFLLIFIWRWRIFIFRNGRMQAKLVTLQKKIFYSPFCLIFFLFCFIRILLRIAFVVTERIIQQSLAHCWHARWPKGSMLIDSHRTRSQLQESLWCDNWQVFMVNECVRSWIETRQLYGDSLTIIRYI